MTPDRDELHAEDARAAGQLPCLLPDASDAVFAVFLAGLSGDARHQLNTMATAMAVLGERLVVLTLVELPDEGDALVSALALRSWLLGVTASSQLLASMTDDGSTYANETRAAAKRRLKARYERDPRTARADGLDVVAGGLLDD